MMIISRRRRVSALAALGLLATTTAVALVATPAIAVPGRVVVTATTALDSTPSKQIYATCPDGAVILGGGGSVDGGNPSVGIYWSDPLQSSHWLVRAREYDATFAGDWSLTVWAICGPAPSGYQILHYQQTGLGYAAVTAACPVGQKVLGAGAYAWYPELGWVLDGVQPNAGLTSVVAEVYQNEKSTPLPPEVGVVASVICVDPVPLQQRVTATTVLNSAGLKSGSATCPAGTAAHSMTGDINGGFGEVQLGVMAPFNSRIGTESALVKAWEDSTGYDLGWSVTTFAICAA